MPVSGIAHAAGVIDFVDLQGQTSERMAAVFKPKVVRTPFKELRFRD